MNAKLSMHAQNTWGFPGHPRDVTTCGRPAEAEPARRFTLMVHQGRGPSGAQAVKRRCKIERKEVPTDLTVRLTLDCQCDGANMIYLTKRSRERKTWKEGHRWECNTAPSGITGRTVSNGGKTISETREGIAGSGEKRMGTMGK